jgi:anti-sigma factor RsiW
MRTVTMHDPWLERLSDYLDDQLAGDDARRLEEHLQTCDVCRVTLAELRDVVACAHAAQDTEPARDLWAGISTTISAPAASPAADIEGVLPLRRSPQLPTAAQPRRFSFSAPQLAAAAMLLLSLGGAAVWLLGGAGYGGSNPLRTAEQPVAGTILLAAHQPDAAEADEHSRLAALQLPTTEHDTEVAALERTLEEVRDQLDPATVEVIERSLEAIDHALESARAALAEDPRNPYLHRQLDGAMQKKLAVLRRASEPRRAAT